MNSNIQNVDTSVDPSGVAAINRFNLCEHATVVTVNIYVGMGARKCKEAAKNAAVAGGADENRIIASLVDIPNDEPHKKKVTDIASEVRNWYKNETHPWVSDSSRLVTNLQYDRIMSYLKARKVEFFEAVKELLDYLPILEAQAATGQGAYSGKFPARAKLEKYIDFVITTQAIADPSDVRLQHVSPEAAREIQAATRAAQNEVVAEGMRRLTERILQTVGHFVEKMDDTELRYHGTTITNVQELAAIIPELNITNDPFVASTARRIAELFNPLEIKEVKKNPELRQELKAKATSILDAVKNMKITSAI